MSYPSLLLIIGLMLLVLAALQWHLHAEDGWIGETWDSEKQERLYYNVLAPGATLCIFISGVWIILS